MQRRSRNSLLRRILFPYTGEEALTRRQGLRVIGVWALFFSFAMLLCTTPFTLAYVGVASSTRIVLILLIAFFSGVVIFGALAWLVVVMNNRAVQIIQQRKAAGTSSTSGGRYGS
jgi:amino acid transporter